MGLEYEEDFSSVPVILLVDDDVLLRTTLKFSLKKRGAEVIEAGSSGEAFRKIREKEPSIVLLDMGMPPNKHSAEEGLKVLDFIQQHQMSPKVIVLTGQDAEKTAYLAVSHGAFDYLQKPVEEQALFQAVERAQLFYEQQQKWQEKEKKHQVHIEVPMGEGVKPIRNLAEEKIVRKVLQQTGFNVHETARVLGIKRENVYYLIKKYQIERPSGSSDNLGDMSSGNLGGDSAR